jgi:AcrR family transcriptional regulator
MSLRKNSKELILDAAEQVVMEAGAAHLSLDVVARKAGVSKGGLMYNFPTKKALLSAMINRLVQQYYEDREKKQKTLGKGPSAALKAGILAQLDPNEKRDHMVLSLLAAAANDPEILEVFRRDHQNHLKELALSGMNFERAVILSLAADGLMLNELLRISVFSAHQKNKIKEEMIRLIDKEGKRGN